MQNENYIYIGIDEAGRGCLAGPVVASAVILSKDNVIVGLDDSKKLSPLKRKLLAKEIFAYSQVGIGVVWQRKIDKINILQATFHAMAKSVNSLCSKSKNINNLYLQIDGNKLIPNIILEKYLTRNIMLYQESIIGGDGLVSSIAAASIIAKTYRDKIMTTLHIRYPQYNFAKHKGYGTKEHIEAIKLYGACPLHRMTFAPLNTILQGKQMSFL